MIPYCWQRRTRPIGRKAAKEEKRKWDRAGMEDSMKKMVDNSEAIAIEIGRKNENLERTVDLEVIGKDTSMMESVLRCRGKQFRQMKQ